MELKITPKCLLFWVNDHFEAVPAPKDMVRGFFTSDDIEAHCPKKYLNLPCVDTSWSKENPESRYGYWSTSIDRFNVPVAWLAKEKQNPFPNEMKAAMLLLDL